MQPQIAEIAEQQTTGITVCQSHVVQVDKGHADVLKNSRQFKKNYLDAKLISGTEIFVDSLFEKMIENGMIQDNYCELSNYDIDQIEKTERKFRKKSMQSEPLNEGRLRLK